MSIKKHVTISFSNGDTCEHNPVVDSDEQWWTLIGEIMVGMNKPSLLTFAQPYGFHRTEDISAIHFADFEPPLDTPPIGLQYLSEG